MRFGQVRNLPAASVTTWTSKTEARQHLELVSPLTFEEKSHMAASDWGGSFSGNYFVKAVLRVWDMIRI